MREKKKQNPSSRLENETTVTRTPKTAMMGFSIHEVVYLFACCAVMKADSVVNSFTLVSRTRQRISHRILRASAAVNETSTTLREIVMTETHMEVPPAPLENELPAKTLDGRLLCASQCAYNASSPYFEGAGFLSGSTTVELTKGVNSVYIGETMDGIVLAFRGTRTKSPLDWLQNAALLLRRIPGIPGRVHAGFYRAVNSLWDSIKSTLVETFDVDTTNPTKIYLTGHSKGGAMASIAAILLNGDTDLPNVTQVVTFASAKAGDSAFAKAYNLQVNQTSYEYHLDIVPFLPPSQATMDAMDENGTTLMEGVLWNDTATQEANKDYIWDFQPVGKRRYIDSNINVLCNVTKELDEQRIKDIERKTLLSLREFAAAHCLTCPQVNGNCKGGYFSAVAAEVCECCPDL